MKPNLDQIIAYFKSLQDTICKRLETLDTEGQFQEDLWERPGGGGGRTRIIEGKHIEKGGVNFSAIHGKMPTNIQESLGLAPNDFSATGVSIVLHPKNPFVPIIHMNVRYFETDQNVYWFGGGIDVTPHYINEKEARNFHQQLKDVCDTFNDTTYEEYKNWADRYFHIKHRKESRGIGGVFFDRLSADESNSKEEVFSFVKNLGNTFLKIYEPLFKNNYSKDYTEDNIYWRNLRRSRYVEFNLVWDRGTKFGLQTNGRIESILMSMPPLAQWQYDHKVKEGSAEEKTLQYLKKKLDWLNYKEA